MTAHTWPRYVPLRAGSPAADFATEGMGKGEEMGSCVHMAGVSSGKRWGEFPAGVSPTALDVSGSAPENCKLEHIWITRCFFMALWM